MAPDRQVTWTWRHPDLPLAEGAALAMVLLQDGAHTPRVFSVWLDCAHSALFISSLTLFLLRLYILRWACIASVITD